MSDIVERLRKWHNPVEIITGDVQLYLDAADEIERLQAALLYCQEMARSSVVVRRTVRRALAPDHDWA